MALTIFINVSAAIAFKAVPSAVARLAVAGTRVAFRRNVLGAEITVFRFACRRAFICLFTIFIPSNLAVPTKRSVCNLNCYFMDVSGIT